MTNSQQSLNEPISPPPPTVEKRGNGLGVAALVIGIVALLGAFIPFANYGTGFLAFVGLVLGIIGLVLKGRKRKIAIAGTILSGAALILSIVMAIVYTAVFAAAIQTGIDEEIAASDVDVALVYEVTGDSTDASITYATFANGESGTEQSTGQALPFTKELTVKAGGNFDFAIFTLTANNGATGADITCRITLDGEIISEQTSTGPYATALCSSTD